jgi:hypothetical protein
MYECSVCSKEVQILEDGTIVRTCEHTDAPVIASMSAICAGKGTMK